jgi:ribonuclease P/MRP protein subunit POP5
MASFLRFEGERKEEEIFSLITMGLKPMLPTLREKKRYLVFEVESEKKTNQKGCTDAISASMSKFLGELGMARAGIKFLPDWKNSKGIMRISHKEVDNVKAALSLVTDIGGRAKVSTVFVSGVLDKARKKLD